MTKEELEKEANKYADENATPDLNYSFRVDIFEASKEGYLAGAEPREKRIAELEETLGKCAKMPVLYCLGAKETIIKAKELVKEYMFCTKGLFEEVYPELIKKAEQFLSEVEK